MATVSEGTVLRVVAVMLFPDNVILQNVFHTVLLTVVGDNELSDIVEDMVEYIEDAYVDIGTIMDADVDPSEVIVYEYDPSDDDFDEVGSDAWTLPAGVVGTQMPHGVAGLVNFSTINPDVSGKKYFGGISEDSWIEGGWNAGALAAMAGSAADIIAQFTATITGNIYTGVVWSPTKTTPYLYDGTYSTSAIAAYQRRRKPGVGI